MYFIKTITYLNKIFLRFIFLEEFQKDYLKELGGQLEEQERKEMELIERKYRREFLEQSVLNE